MSARARDGAARRSGADRCPGVLATHEAADGRLARVRLPGGAPSPDALDAVADLADDGNGIVEITARANLQVRGLTAPPAAARVRRLRLAGLLPSPRHERARNILAGPLAGRHPAALVATDEIVAALDRGLCADPALAALSGRFLFAVDDGSGAVAVRDADVAVVAEGGDLGPTRMRLVLDGVPTARWAEPAAAAGLALAAARTFLALGDRVGGGAWRVRDIAAGAEVLAHRIGTHPLARPMPAHRFVLGGGSIVQRDGAVAITAVVPLGRLSPDGLRRLAEAARALGAAVRTSPWRTITLVDVAAGSAGAAWKALASAGLVVEGGDGWHRLSACAGMGACASAAADVRAAAARRAPQRAAGAPAEHWSGCERRCGEPRSVGVAVVAGDRRVAVWRHGRGDEVADVDAALALLRTEGAP